MDMHNEKILREYDRDYESFEIIRDIVLGKIKEYLDEQSMLVTVFEGRIKSRRSLEGKLNLKGYKYDHLSDLTDIFGARVVTFYDDEVTKIASWVAETFEMDWENSVDKRKLLNADQFGYMSLHYICRIPESMYSDPDHPAVNEYRFELQMRTALQHVWATVFHDTGYKSDIEVPKAYIRSLNRMAGLLELADAEFLSIRNSLDEYRNNIRQLMAEGRFDEMSLDGDTFKDYLSIRPFDELNQRIASINGAEIQEVSVISYLPILDMMGFKTIGDIEKMKADYSDAVYEWCRSQFEGTDLDIMSSSLALQDLCVVYMANSELRLAGVQKFLQALYPTRKTNGRSAGRMFKQLISLGLVETSEWQAELVSELAAGK